MEEDIRLVERYIAGDGRSVEELVMKYQKQIYALVYRMTNDIEETKDLTQKTFVKAINGLKGFRKETSFKTWLYQIAINISLAIAGTLFYPPAYYYAPPEPLFMLICFYRITHHYRQGIALSLIPYGS